MSNQEKHDDAQIVLLIDDLKIVRRNLKRQYQLNTDLNKRDQAMKAWAKADELIKQLEDMYADAL
jgi:hypothetical protein